MDVTELEKAGVNYAEGLKRFSDKKELYEKYIIKFFQDPSLEDLDANIKNGRYQEAFQCVHTLKGITGNLSLPDVYACCCILAEALRNNQTENLQSFFAGF